MGTCGGSFPRGWTGTELARREVFARTRARFPVRQIETGVVAAVAAVDKRPVEPRVRPVSTEENHGKARTVMNEQMCEGTSFSDHSFGSKEGKLYLHRDVFL